MRYGLNETILEKILNVFRKYKEVDEVIIYGSRAKGNYRNGSDIDLTLLGDRVNLDILNKINLELDDSSMPYTFDLSIYRQIKKPELLDHIKRVGKIIYKRI